MGSVPFKGVDVIKKCGFTLRIAIALAITFALFFAALTILFSQFTVLGQLFSGAGIVSLGVVYAAQQYSSNLLDSLKQSCK